MDEKKEVLWMGLTPMERGSQRLFSLVRVLHKISINFPNSTDGMGNYEDHKLYLDEFDIIATDQEKIDESWEGFFEAKNWGKQIVQYINGEWIEVRPGFSKQNGGKQK